MKNLTYPIQRIGIDLDNTVADYMRGAIPLMREHYNLVPDYTLQATTVEEVFGLTKGTRPPNMRQHLYEDLHLFRQLPKLESDVEQLTHALYQRPGRKIYFITARSAAPVIIEDTIFWLHTNGFVFDDIFFVENKAELCKMMKIDVMVEDEVGQLLNLRRAGIDVVVPNRLWNQNLPSDPHHIEREQGRLARVGNWREALTAIEEFLE